MPKITVTIFGTSVEIEDEKMTATALATLAMKKLKEAAAIPINGKGIGGTGFHTDALPVVKAESYNVPVTVQPEVRKR